MVCAKNGSIAVDQKASLGVGPTTALGTTTEYPATLSIVLY